MSEPGARLLESLPAIYRAGDTSGHLQCLLGVFEEVLFRNDTPDSPGIEQQIEAIPSFFSPSGVGHIGEHIKLDEHARAPDRFLPWLATWVAFKPHALFTAEQLRVIISGIAPLYQKRGTRAYLEQLLELCFPEILDVDIDDNPILGFIIGQAKVGEDTLFGDERPFWFRISIEVQRQSFGSRVTESHREFEQRVRAIIDFAKPAHTGYDLRLDFSAREQNGRYTV
ncbi:MAG: hypothetical protein H0X43_07625 [Nitrosospira sp.]|nr:hypothetical protein [Nitrosospira sp.]